MSWYVYSILASLSFAGMVLCTRYLGNKGFSSKQILLFLFGFAFFGFLIINKGLFITVWESEYFLAFIIIATATSIFAVIGNWANFTATIKAPNPGFVGAIKNSNVLLIVFLSTLIFKSSLSLLKLLGAVFIIVGIVMLIMDKNNITAKQTEKSFLRWDILAIIGALSFAIMVLGVKKMSQMGFSSPQINLFIFGFNFLAFLILSRKDLKNYFQNKIKLKEFLPVVFGAAIFSFVANIFNIKGIAIAPNPGYHESIKDTQVLFTTLLSAPLLGASLNRQNLFGVVIISIGVIILII